MSNIGIKCVSACIDAATGRVHMVIAVGVRCQWTCGGNPLLPLLRTPRVWGPRVVPATADAETDWSDQPILPAYRRLPAILDRVVGAAGQQFRDIGPRARVHGWWWWPKLLSKRNGSLFRIEGVGVHPRGCYRRLLETGQPACQVPMVDTVSLFEDMRKQSRIATRTQVGLCACSDAKCCASSTLALDNIFQFPYEEVRSQYDTVRGAYNMIIQEEDSPSFAQFLQLVKTCKEVFQCSSTCQCSCHFGQIEHWNDISRSFRKPSLFNFFASRLKGLPLGNKIDISSFTEEERRALTFGGQEIVVEGRQVVLYDFVKSFDRSESTSAYEISLDELKDILSDDVSLHDFNKHDAVSAGLAKLPRPPPSAVQLDTLHPRATFSSSDPRPAPA